MCNETGISNDHNTDLRVISLSCNGKKGTVCDHKTDLRIAGRSCNGKKGTLCDRKTDLHIMGRSCNEKKSSICDDKTDLRIAGQSCFWNKSSKRGTAMVEAAVVIPIVILAVVSVIYIMLVMFNDTAQKCDVDYSALCAAGSIAENFSVGPDQSSKFSFSREGIIFPSVKGSSSYSTSLGGLFRSGSENSTAAGEVYSFSEEQYIRNMDLLGTFAGH